MVFGELSVRVSEDSLEILSKDIIFFAKKLKKITLIGSKYNRDEGRIDDCLVWLDNVISSCTNLLSINIQTRIPSSCSSIHSPIYVAPRTHDEYRQSFYVIDLIRFLEAAPALKEFRVRSAYKIKGSSRRTSTNLCLELLDLTVVHMNVNSLIIIVNYLKKIKCLRMKILNLNVADVEQGAFNAKELFDYLKDSTSDIENFRIDYLFRNGKEPKIIVRRR